MNRRRLRGAAWLGAVLAVLAAVPAGLAQGRVDFEYDNHAFRYILSAQGLRPLGSLTDALTRPGDSILIVFGDTSVLPNAWSLRQFVERGGALFVATDRPTRDPLEQAFGVEIPRLLVEGGPDTAVYRNSEECPLVQAVPNAQPALFQTRLRVASNKPSYLEFQPGSVKPLVRLAEFPAGCRVVSGRRYWPSRYPLAFAVGGDLGQGRVLILADHSIFINGMMLQTDNGNFDFAYNCVHWLKNGRRSNVAFFDEGTLVNDFRVPLVNAPMPPISPVDAANQIIAALEEDDLLNKLILHQFTLSQVVSAWLIALTVGLLAYGLYRLMRSGYHVDPQAPLAAPAMGASGAGAAIVEQRRRSLIADGNLWEPARDLARQWFADVGYAAPPVTAGSNQPARLQVEIHAGWWRRWQMQEQVRRLWRLAFSPRPRRVSRRDLDRLRSQLNDLRSAVADGRLQFPGARTPA